VLPNENQVMVIQKWHGANTIRIMEQFNQGESDESESAANFGSDSEDDRVIQECNSQKALKKYWFVDEFDGLVDKRGHPDTCRVKPRDIVSYSS